MIELHLWCSGDRPTKRVKAWFRKKYFFCFYCIWLIGSCEFQGKGKTSSWWWLPPFDLRRSVLFTIAFHLTHSVLPSSERPTESSREATHPKRTKANTWVRKDGIPSGKQISNWSTSTKMKQQLGCEHYCTGRNSSLIIARFCTETKIWDVSNPETNRSEKYFWRSNFETYFKTARPH